jgi:Tfp pilus assembly protein PilV
MLTQIRQKPICDNHGMSMIEVLIAMFLTSVAVLGIFSLQAPALKQTARADYLGRAAVVLQNQIETTEAFVMNPCNTVPLGTTTTSVKMSGMAGTIAGDATYNVSTTIASAGTNIWKVTITVTWPMNATGITTNVMVSRQEFFKVGC